MKALNSLILSLWAWSLFTSSAAAEEAKTIITTPAATETSTPSEPEEKQVVTLEVLDAYLEIHSGPGRGYPILHTLEQGEPVAIFRRRGNWYHVKSRRDVEGWIHQEKLARTIAPSGMPAALPEINHGDFLAQQGRVGFMFGEQGNLTTASGLAGFRIFSFLGAEMELGQIFGKDIDGLTYGGNLVIEPIQSWSFTPFISLGAGQQVWQQKQKLNVGDKNKFYSNYRFTGAGINYYIGFNFVVRGEYRKVSLSGNNGSSDSTSWRIGFSSFF